jgi:hypothetical protein
MNFKKLFATNKDKEEKGVWVKGPEGSEFLIARAGNASFSKLAGELMRPHRKLIQIGKADDKLITEIAAEITSRTVLLDWKGVKDDSGKDEPYTQETAKKRLIEYPDFADFIAGLSQQQSQYQDSETEERVKNS